MKPLKKRLDRDGLPINPNDWTSEDWQDLHRGIQRIIRQIAARHKELDEDIFPLSTEATDDTR